MARVSSAVREIAVEDEVTRAVRSYKAVKDEVDLLTKRKNDLRDLLMDAIEQGGFADDTGSLWIELDDEVDGVTALKRERRSKAALDEEAAERILAERGLSEQCFKTVRVVDEDAVFAALYDGTLDEADVDLIFPQKVTWALVLK